MLLTSFTLANLLTGFLFVSFGLWLYYYPPKYINAILGYRTEASMRNQQTWDAGNKYASRATIITGSILLLLGILSLFVAFLSGLHILIALGLIIIFSFSIFLLTERYLEKKFLEDGSLRK